MGGRFKHESKTSVLIDGYYAGNDKPCLCGGLCVEFLGKAGYVNTVRAQRRTYGGERGLLYLQEAAI